MADSSENNFNRQDFINGVKQIYDQWKKELKDNKKSIQILEHNIKKLDIDIKKAKGELESAENDKNERIDEHTHIFSLSLTQNQYNQWNSQSLSRHARNDSFTAMGASIANLAKAGYICGVKWREVKDFTNQKEQLEAQKAQLSIKNTYLNNEIRCADHYLLFNNKNNNSNYIEQDSIMQYATNRMAYYIKLKKQELQQYKEVRTHCFLVNLLRKFFGLVNHQKQLKLADAYCKELEQALQNKHDSIKQEPCNTMDSNSTTGNISINSLRQSIAKEEAAFTKFKHLAQEEEKTMWARWTPGLYNKAEQNNNIYNSKADSKAKNFKNLIKGNTPKNNTK